MAQQTKSLQRPKNWRRIYFKILKKFVKEKFIYSFQIIHTIDVKEVHGFMIKIKDEKDLKIYFFKSKYRNKVMLGEDFFNHISIMVGNEAKPKILHNHLRLFIKDRIYQRSLGMKIEEIFYERVQKDIIGLNSITEVRKTNKQEDENEGIDFYLKYKNFEVPIQIKSSAWKQEKHKEIYPFIPSFIFKTAFDNEKLRIYLDSICHAYTEGRIIHK